MNTRKYNQLSKEILGEKYDFTKLTSGYTTDMWDKKKQNVNRTASSSSRVSNSNTKKSQ